MVTYIAAKHRGETGLVYEDRDDVAPDLDIGDAAYAITRTIANMPRCNGPNLFKRWTRNKCVP